MPNNGDGLRRRHQHNANENRQNRDRSGNANRQHNDGNNKLPFNAYLESLVPDFRLSRITWMKKPIRHGSGTWHITTSISESCCSAMLLSPSGTWVTLQPFLSWNYQFMMKKKLYGLTAHIVKRFPDFCDYPLRTLFR